MKNALTSKRVLILVALALSAATVVTYLQVFRNNFIDYDDAQYITQNPFIQAGLTWASVKWALTAGIVSNWHPLTWISHMLDYQSFGLNPVGHHAVNLLLHVANALILLIVLNRMTTSLWKSTLVATLFALHPMHVESVAWAAERKDVLSTFFMFLSIWAYTGYVESPSVRRYVPVALLFGLALMSKPIVVTMPLVLLFLDYWPLNRAAVSKSERLSPWVRLVWEKAPLFVLSAAGCAATYLVQKGGGAMTYADRYPLGIRIDNAIVSYVGYIAKMLWPHNMAILYPHPENTIPVWQVAGSVVLLLGVTILAIVLRRKASYLLSGWLWYLCTLIPMIGLVQVGVAGMGDRYTYIPYIGLFVMLAWGVPSLVGRSSSRNTVIGLSAASVCVLLMLSAVTHAQLRHWQDGRAVFQHALDVTKDNEAAHVRVGTYDLDGGNTDEAISHFQEALRINPENYRAHGLLGRAFTEKGDTDAAIREYEDALSIREDPVIHCRLAMQLAAQGNLADAISHYEAAIDMDPDYAEAHYNLGNAYMRTGRLDDAVGAYGEAIRIKPDYADAHFNLGVVLDGKHDMSQAMTEYQAAIKSKPDHVEAHANLAIDLYINGKYRESWSEVAEAEKYGCKINPDFLKALSIRMPRPAR